LENKSKPEWENYIGHCNFYLRQKELNFDEKLIQNGIIFIWSEKEYLG